MPEMLTDQFDNLSDGFLKLFERWRKGGAGILITGNTPVDRWHLAQANF
jgi:hypothetical protein